MANVSCVVNHPSMSLEHRVAIGAAFSDAHESKMPTEGKHTFEVLLDGVNHYVTGTVSFRRGPHQCALEVESVKPHDEQASAADLAPENNSEAPVADPAPENTTAAPAPDPAPENNSGAEA